MRAVSDRPLLKELASRDVRRPVYSITRRDDVLHFSDGVTFSLAGAFPGVASTVRIKADNPVTVWLSMHAHWHTYLVNAPYLTNAMNGVSVTNHLIDVEWASLKADITDTEYVIGAATWDGHVSVDRYSLTDFTLASTIAVPELQCSADATMVKRMEVVCDLDGTNSLLVFGIHDITNLLSTLQFWKIGSANSRQLETVVQIPMGTAPDWTEYDTGAQYCANVYVIDNGNGYTIVCNNLATGRAVQFRWNPVNGIESQLTQIIQIDVDASTVTFTPTGLIKIADLYYLSGLFTRPMTDGTTDSYCVYLTSADAWNWSVGERSFLVSGDATKGMLAYLPDMENVVFVGLSPAGIKTYHAPARVIDGEGTAEDITEGMVHWSIDEATDSADSMTLDMLAGTPIHEGDHVAFSAGWTKDDGTPYLVVMGDYVADQVPSIVTDAGPQVANISLLDRAGRIANDWKASVDVSQYSRTNHEDPLNGLDKMVVKSVIRDAKIKSQSDPENVAKAITITDGALYSDSLNDPFVGYSTERDDRDGIFYGEVEFQNVSGKCQQSFGFIFGGDTGRFNAVVIPGESTWTGHEFASVGPQVMISDLPPINTDTTKDEWIATSDPAPDPAKTGYNWNASQRLVGLAVSANIDAIAHPTMMIPATAVNAAAYRPAGAFHFATGVKYQAAMRKSGRTVQVYAKVMDYTPANCIANSAWILAAEFKLDESLRHSFNDRPYTGMCVSTDVWASKNAFQQAAYGDIDLGLSAAWNSSPANTVFAGVVGRTKNDNDEDPGANGGSQHRAFHWEWVSPGSSLPASLWVGRWFILSWTADQDPGHNPCAQWAYVHHLLPYGGIYIATTGTPGDHSWDTGSTLVDGPDLNCFIRGTTTVQIWLPEAQPVWGGAASGYESTNGNLQNGAGVSVINGESVDIAAIQVKGTAMFIDDGGSSSAISIRKVSTNNRIHTLLSGDDAVGGTGRGWDATNPAADPHTWSIKLNHGVFFDYLPSHYSLDNEGFFKVEDEYIRYLGEEFNQTDIDVVKSSWCAIPTFYCVAKTASKPTILEHWNAFTDPIPGGFTQFATPKGMLVEIRSRSSNSNIAPDTTRVYRVKDTHDRDYSTAGGHVAHQSQLELDQQYDGDITQPSISGNKTAAADIIIWSGRAQMKSDKALHDATATVALYPMQLTNPPATDPYPWLIRVDSFDQYQGLYNSIEDDLRYTNALAGVREIHFRSLGSFSGNLTNSPVTLHTNLSNFVLDIKAHLFGIDDNRLRITFRGGQYILDLQHLITEADLVSGRMGNVRYLLLAPLSNIVKGASEAKWLDRNTIAVSGSDISGTYVESYEYALDEEIVVVPGVHTEDPYVQLALRLIVRDNKIIIEVEGQQVWTVNLDHFNYVDTAVTHSYKFLDYGAVTIQYTGSADVPVTARLLELSAEIEAHIIDMNSTLGDAVGFLLEGRHIWSRAEPDGGTLYTTNLVRENWSSDAVDLVENITQDQQIDTGMEVAGHVITSGAEFGEYMDAEWIRLYGYTFEMGQNRLLNTVQDSRDEARIILRTAKEHARQRQFSGPGLLDLQPLDRLTVSRPASGDISATTTAGYIVKSKHTEGDINSITGELDTFLEQSL